MAHLKVSVILPTYNEGHLNILPKILAALVNRENVEVICVDGESTDQTPAVINQFGARPYTVANSNRAQRINYGFSKANAEMILFHHPRSIIEPKGFDFLIQNSHKKIWGGFTHCFDTIHPLLQFTSWYSNHIRPSLQSIVYLDHCIFAHRDLLTKLSQPLWPEVDIFEDTEFCQKIRPFGKPVILPYCSTTSAIRFRKNGILRQGCLNQWLKVSHWLGSSHRLMNKNYEKNLDLNQKTTRQP